MASQFTFQSFSDEKLSNNSTNHAQDVVIQLKLFNDAIVIRKRKYQNQQLRYRVTPVDLRRRESEVNEMEVDEETNSNDMFLKDQTIEIAVLNDDEWKFCKQETVGRLYNSSEFVIFKAQVEEADKTGFKIDFFIQSLTGQDQIGFAYLLPSNMKGSSGSFATSINGNKNLSIGEITVHYLIIKPLIGYASDYHLDYGSIWKPTKKGFDIGHRGAGNARRTDKIENVLENTIASFNYASQHFGLLVKGADLVELDVQLSKDKIPVIYHDFNVNIFMKKKNSTQEHEFLQLAVHDLTQQQLQMLKLSPVHKANKQYDFSETDNEENQPFPTLKKVLEVVNPKCGFNVEIKYPQLKRDGIWEAEVNFDLNEYLDIILKTILENAGNRYIMLSCFHPDLCSMIRLKQNRYPLLFLTQGISQKYQPYVDTRTSTIQMATHFARSMGFLGIDVHAEDLLKDRSLIQFVKTRGLVLFCWGEDLNRTEVIQELKKDGVDGVIYDKVDVFSNKVFVTQENQQELFEIITGQKSNESAKVFSVDPNESEKYK